MSYIHHHRNTQCVSSGSGTRASVPLQGPLWAQASGQACGTAHCKPGKSISFGHLSPFVQDAASKRSPARVQKSLMLFLQAPLADGLGCCNRSSKIKLGVKNNGENKLFLWMLTIFQFSHWLFFWQVIQKSVRGKQIGRKQWQCTNTFSNITEVYQGLSIHIPSGRQVLISPKSRENKGDTEMLETAARQRGIDEQQC